jgi:cell division protein FtsL
MCLNIPIAANFVQDINNQLIIFIVSEHYTVQREIMNLESHVL